MHVAPSRAHYLIGYTDMRCDDPRGQFYNWRTSRAMIVRADGSARREIGSSAIANENSWTSFVRWWPDGRAVINTACESPENYAWEKEHRTFRMTEGNWLTDGCLVDNKDYMVYIAEKDGSNPRRVDEDPRHTFQFIPTWSPDGQWDLTL